MRVVIAGGHEKIALPLERLLEPRRDGLSGESGPLGVCCQHGRAWRRSVAAAGFACMRSCRTDRIRAEWMPWPGRPARQGPCPDAAAGWGVFRAFRRGPRDGVVRG